MWKLVVSCVTWILITFIKGEKLLNNLIAPFMFPTVVTGARAKNVFTILATSLFLENSAKAIVVPCE